MLAAAILSITLAPPLMVLLLRGRFRTAATNPVSRLLRAVYQPVAVLVVRYRVLVVAAAAALMIATVPVFQRLGSEFMPPLDEGSLLVMPTTFPGIAIEEARRAMQRQHRTIMSFAEVASVHGKAGRAETATDPAQLDMIESVITLRPRDEWPMRDTRRWYSGWSPEWLKRVFGTVWPEEVGGKTELVVWLVDTAARKIVRTLPVKDVDHTVGHLPMAVVTLRHFPAG